jgi:signal transduction histidine kinase
MQRRARASEEEKRRIRFEFVRVLGHELKAPLAAVEGYLLAIREKTLGEELSAYDVMIERSLVRLAGMRKLIVDLLDLTRLESGQRRRELERLDVREIAHAALETVRAEAERRRISVTLHGEGPVPFTGDRGELELVMNNLVTNAVKYNRDEGKVEISLELSGGTLRLRVSDTGIGLTPEDQARLFQDFVRIKNEKTRAIGGSGLGLSTVRKVAQLYGGDATVRSEFGVGSTFEVTLAEQHPQPPAA